MTTGYYAMVRCDELWVRGALREERRGEGEAVESPDGIAARNRIEDVPLRTALRQSCSAAMDSLHAAISGLRDARIRAVVTASTDGLESTVTVTIGSVSIVTTPANLPADNAALRQLLAPRATAPPPARPLPIVWWNGSAAVLLHEAVGHAAEHGHPPAAFPSWLGVRDVDRGGLSADLLSSEVPVASRRESFRHVPLRRMTSLIATQDGAPFRMPDERIEVHLVAGGAYEPLTQTVTIDVAVADLVTSGGSARIPRFAIRASREAVARSIAGAAGDPIRYPGVICSREGQELFVASHAPVMITEGLG